MIARPKGGFAESTRNMNQKNIKGETEPAKALIENAPPCPQPRRKVCVIVTSLLIVRFFLLPHLDALAQKHDVTLIVNVDDPGFTSELGIPLTVVHVDIRRKISLWHDAMALWRIYRIIRSSAFDLVHSVSPKGGLLGMAAAWLACAPVRWHTFQGEVWANRRGVGRLALKHVDWLMARLATHLTVVSASEQKFLMEEGVIPAKKSLVLAHGSISGVPLDRFKPDTGARQRVRQQLDVPEQGIVFLYVGRLNRDKGLLDLARAFTTVAAAHASAWLLVVGPDEDAMQAKMAAHLGAATSRVRFVPYTGQPEQYMAAAEVLVLPSHREGFGVVIIEAAAAGIPAIGSRIYGITDAIVENETGELFEAGNVEELASKMLRMASNASVRAKLGANAAQRARRDFDQKAVVDATSAHYDRLIKEAEIRR
jgi:glycosyltransferase involved in cell wall biosynthesis